MHQATRAEGKNGLREFTDILVFMVILNDFSLLYYFNFNLWCVILLQVILYSVYES